MNPIEEQTAFVDVAIVLTHWGQSQRGEYSLLGFRSRTTEYDLMSGKLCGIHEGCTSGYLYVDVGVMDTDRRISALPDDLRRVLYVEYVLGGSAKQRVKQAKMSRRTYYRKLVKASVALYELMVADYETETTPA